jgi:hypothetical protein
MAKETLQILTTFTLCFFAGYFLGLIRYYHAINYIQGIFSKSIFQLPEVRPTFFY